MSDDNRERRGGHRGGRGGGNNRQQQPKYNDTDEAKEQQAKIRRIEDTISDVQRQLGGLSKDKRQIERKAKLTVRDKEHALERIEQLAKRISDVEKERQALSEVYMKSMKEVEAKRVVEQKARGDLPYKRKKNETDAEFDKNCRAAIDSKVEALNHRLETETVALSEEKKILKEIQKVRSLKNQIHVYLSRSNQYFEALQTSNRSKYRLDKKLEYIGKLKREKAELEESLVELENRKEEVEKGPESTKLSSAEQQLQDKLDKLIQQLRQAKEEVGVKREAWYEARREKARKAKEKIQKQREEKRAKYLQEQQDARRAAREERKLEIPFDTEIRACTQLIEYLEGLLPKEGAEEEKKEEQQQQKGHVGKKDNFGADDWAAFASKGKKNKRKGGGGGKKKKKFVVNLQSVSDFQALGFQAPLSYEEVPKSLEAVKSKLEEFQKKSKTERARVLKQIEAEEKAEAKEEAAAAKKAEEAAAAAEKDDNANDNGADAAAQEEGAEEKKDDAEE